MLSLMVTGEGRTRGAAESMHVCVDKDKIETIVTRAWHSI